MIYDGRIVSVQQAEDTDELSLGLLDDRREGRSTMSKLSQPADENQSDRDLAGVLFVLAILVSCVIMLLCGYDPIFAYSLSLSKARSVPCVP